MTLQHRRWLYALAGITLAAALYAGLLATCSSAGTQLPADTWGEPSSHSPRAVP